jgi:glycosyltransferase involved in cell wall biosynthesis
MTEPIRLMHVAGTSVGGEWFVRQVVELQRRGHELLAIVPDDGPVADALRAAGIAVEVVRFKGRRVADLPRVAAAQLRLVRLARSYRPTVVHAHLFKAIVMTRIAGWIGRVPHRVSQWPGAVHRDVTLLRLMDRLSMPLDSLTLGSCEAIAEACRQDGARNVDVSYYGLRTSEWDPTLPELVSAREEVIAELWLPPDSSIVTMVAHMYPTSIAAFRAVGVKGHETFIDAAADVTVQRPRARFLVVGDELVGDGSYRTSLEARAQAAGLADRLLFLGHRGDVARLIAASDVVAVPSMSESASYSAMQALLLNRPVVASRVGGLPDTVQHEESGLLVPPGDATALSEAIVRLLDDPIARDRMGRVGRERVRERFDIARTVDRLEANYLRLTGG